MVSRKKIFLYFILLDKVRCFLYNTEIVSILLGVYPFLGEESAGYKIQWNFRIV